MARTSAFMFAVATLIGGVAHGALAADLIAAVKRGDVRLARAAIDAHSDPNESEADGTTWSD